MPDKYTDEYLNSLLNSGGKQPSGAKYSMTVDDIINQSKSGDLPKTIAKKRVKETYKKVKNEEPTEQQTEKYTDEYLNSLLESAPVGMGDLKVAEQNQPIDPLYEAGVLPQIETGINYQQPQGQVTQEPTGETIQPREFQVPDVQQLHQDKAKEFKDISARTKYGYQDLGRGDVGSFIGSQFNLAKDLGGMTGIDERLIAMGEDLINKGKQTYQHFNEATDEFKKGNYKNFALKSGLTGVEVMNLVGSAIGMPFAVPLETLREVSPESGQVLDATFGTIGKVGEYSMEVSPVYRLAMSIGDTETANALKELGNITAQFVIPMGLHGLIKTRLESVPYAEVKSEVKRIQQDIFKENPHLDSQEMGKTVPQHYNPDGTISTRLGRPVTPDIDAHPLIVDRSPRINAPIDNTGFKKPYTEGIIETVPTELLKPVSTEVPNIITDPSKYPAQVLIKNDVGVFEPSDIGVNMPKRGSERILEPQELGKTPEQLLTETGQGIVKIPNEFSNKTPQIGTETGQGSIINSKPIQSINPEIKPPLKGSNEVSTQTPVVKMVSIKEIDTRLAGEPNVWSQAGYIDAMKKTIQEGGEIPPILISKTGKFLRDGRHRLEAYKQLGYEKVPVIEGYDPNVGVVTKEGKVIPLELKEYKGQKYKAEAEQPKRLITDEMVADANKIIRSSPESNRPFGVEVQKTDRRPKVIKQKQNIENPFTKSVIQEPVYHGTDRPIVGEFNTEPFGTHFGSLRTASEFTDYFFRAENQGELTGANISKVFIDLKNPIVMSDIGGFIFGEPILHDVYTRGYITKSEYQKLLSKHGYDKDLTPPQFFEKFRNDLNYTPELAKDVKTLLQKKGYDGYIYENTTDAGIPQNSYMSYAVFDPKQIREVYSKKNRIVTDEMVAEADRIIRSSPDQLSANPFDYYGKMSKAYLVKGARFIEDGIIDFKEWSRKMINEFGPDIAPILRQLYDDSKGFMTDSKKTVETPKVETKTNADVVTESIFPNAEKKYGNVEKYLYDDKLDVETGKKLKSILEEAIADTYNLENNPTPKQSKFLQKIVRGVADQFHNMTKKYGSNGAEMVYRLHEGNQTINRIFHTLYPYLVEIKKIKGETDALTMSKVNELVVSALKNRANAEAILKDNPLAKKYYDNLQQFYDGFRQELKDNGVSTLDDYFTSISQSRALESLGDIENSLKLDEGKSWASLNQAIGADSPYVKKRTGEWADEIHDATFVAEKYFHSMSKYLAYKNAVDYFYGDFTKAMPRLLKRNSLEYANELIKNNISPDFLQNKTLSKLRDNVYRNALWMNPKSTLQNMMQRRLVDFFVQREAYNLAKQNYKQSAELRTPQVFKLMNELQYEIPRWQELETGMTTKVSKMSEAMNKVDSFQKVEKSNWNFSHYAGMFDAVIKSGEYKKLISEGKAPLEALESALNNVDVYKSAYRKAIEVSNRTQFGALPFNRPRMYNNSIVRLMAMFTRFKFGQLQVMRDTIRKTEGVDGVLANNILRKGFTEDAHPVEVLREVENARKSLEGLNERISDVKTKQLISSHLDFLKKSESELNGIIKTLEPLKPKKEIMAKWLKYYVATSAVSFGYQMLTNWIIYGLDDDADRPSIANMLQKTAYDMSPLPFYGTNPRKFFSNPLLPDADLFIYGNFNKKGFTKEMVKWGVRISPVGFIDRLAMGKPSEKLVNAIFDDPDTKNPRPIRELESDLRKEQQKDQPDLMRLKILQQQIDQAKYNSKYSKDYKDAERERFFKSLAKDKKLHPDKFQRPPALDSMEFERQWNKKVLENQLPK